MKKHQNFAFITQALINHRYKDFYRREYNHQSWQLHVSRLVGGTYPSGLMACARQRASPTNKHTLLL